MKIIDLLNKIANGEDVPVKIKYKGRILYYDDEDNETNNYNATFNYYDKDGNKGLFSGWIGQYINNEVEILEEEKKIPEKLETFKDKNNEIFLDDLCYKYMPIHKDSLSFNEQVIVDKLNEALDYLKSKES